MDICMVTVVIVNVKKETKLGILFHSMQFVYQRNHRWMVCNLTLDKLLPVLCLCIHWHLISHRRNPFLMYPIF